ncbi:MAG: lipid A-modifier LpxR family protein [Bacteroidota bacterium]
MKTILQAFGLFYITLFALNPVQGQEVSHEIQLPTDLYAPGTQSFFIYLDNDKFSTRLFDEDRDYTNGISFAYSNGNLINSPLFFLNTFLLKKTWRAFHPQAKGLDDRLQFLSPEIKLSSLAYTPRDIAATELITDDRPYASVHYLEFKARLHDKEKNYVHSLSLSYGTLATPAAAFFQKIIHTIGTVRPLPEGWHNQIAHPWEPTMLIQYQRDRIWQPKALPANRSFRDLRESMSVEAGYRVVGSYALTGRYGWYLGKRRQGDLFFYGRLRPHVVAYDANLQGQFRPSAYVVSRKDIYPMRGEAALGLGLNWQWKQNRLSAGYGFYAQSPEARYPNHVRMHYYGRYWVGWIF